MNTSLPLSPLLTQNYEGWQIINHKWARDPIHSLYQLKIEIRFYSIMILIIISGHNFAHVMTAQLPWHVQNCGLIWSLFCKL